MDSNKQPSKHQRSDHGLNNAKTDFAKRRFALWGDRVFSAEEVESMRLDELEGVERASFFHASAALLGCSDGNKEPDYSNEG